MRPIGIKWFGLVAVSDSSLGNAMKDAAALQSDPAAEKIGAQGGYLILHADKELVDGGVGRYSLLEGKGHKLKRAARSSYAAELVAVGDAVDVAQGLRDQMAEMSYGPVARGASMRLSRWQVLMAVSTDSKDWHDRLNSDANVGSSAQNSVTLELASIRESLDRPQTM
eukprot:276158-Pyramimonas_sp.AAC.1